MMLDDLIAIDRRFGRVAIDDNGCWNFTGWTLDDFGYRGMTWKGARKKRVHRIAAHLAYGVPLDGDHVVCHHCDNPSCFRPDHLFIGTRADNNADMVAKGRLNPKGPDRWEFCLRGHPLKGDNVRPQRACKTCIKAYQKELSQLIIAAAHSRGLTQTLYREKYDCRRRTLLLALAAPCLEAAAA